MTNYQQIQARKKIYIPRCARGELTNFEAASKIGISIRSVVTLKKRWKLQGDSVFIRASTGHKAYNLKYDEAYQAKILKLYHEHWEGAPYSTFWRGLRDIEHIYIPYDSLRFILKKHNIKSWRDYRPRKKPKHESRQERPCTGELLQMDASKHDWFMNGTYTNLHGGIDDARHIVTGLYFCDNECRLGYNEVLRQTFENYGVMQAVYIDRGSSFVTSPRGKKLTMEERLQLTRGSDTHFNDLCHKLNIEVILALSAEAKGRIERLWGTLQGILPFYFRRLGIQDNQSANNFIMRWLPTFNREFAKQARSPYNRFRPLPKNFNLDLGLAIKIPKMTDRYGIFSFHEQYFELQAPRKSCVRFTLCLSEQFGIKAYKDGVFYDITLCDDYISDVISSNKMPLVEQDLIARYLLEDIHTGTA